MVLDEVHADISMLSGPCSELPLLLPPHVNKASHLAACSGSPHLLGHPTTTDKAWYWLKCILQRGHLWGHNFQAFLFSEREGGCSYTKEL